MSTFVALYRGATVAAAKLVAVSADPDLVADVSARLLHAARLTDDDAVIRAVESGRRRALRLIAREVRDGRS